MHIDKEDSLIIPSALLLSAKSIQLEKLVKEFGFKSIHSYKSSLICCLM